MNTVKNYFSTWTTFMRIQALATLILGFITLFFGGNAIIFFTCIVNIFAGAELIQGRVATYYLSTINVLIYSFVSFQNRLYGEVMLNLLYYVPMGVIGIILWRKHKTGSDGVVKIKKITKSQAVYTCIGTAIAIIIYGFILQKINGNVPFLDSATTIIGIVGLILQTKRISEHYLVWIITNILTFVMWGMMVTLDFSNITMLVQTAFMFSMNVYGYWNWRRISKLQHAAAA